MCRTKVVICKCFPSIANVKVPCVWPAYLKHTTAVQPLLCCCDRRHMGLTASILMIMWMLATLPEEQQGDLVVAEIIVTKWQQKLQTCPLIYTDVLVPLSIHSMAFNLLWVATISTALTQQMFKAMLQQLAQTPGDAASTTEWGSVREVSLQPDRYASTSS